MATGSAPNLEHRSLESSSRPGRSPKTRGSSLRHRTRSQHDVMKESEQSLYKLLEDFEEGRLNAFGEVSKLSLIIILRHFIPTGNSDMLQKVNEIRQMQEKLTVKHFEIDHRFVMELDLFTRCIRENAVGFVRNACAHACIVWLL